MRDVTVKAKDLLFIEPKKLPRLQILRDDFGIEFSTDHQRFERKKLINSALLSGKGIYPLADFVLDYYEMEFSDFRRKVEHHLDCKLSESGYLIGKDDKTMSIRDLSYFANKERKFAKELSEGRERGTWVNTMYSSRFRNNDISNCSCNRLYQSIY
jgi:hypothetical protein